MKSKTSKILKVLIFLLVGSCVTACSWFGPDEETKTETPTQVTGPTEDTEAPVITVSGVSLTESNVVEVGSKLVVPEISVTDNVDQAIEPVVTLHYNGQTLEPNYVTGQYEFAELGTYTLKINAKDSADNAAEEVVVTYLSSDTTAPIIEEIGPQQGMAKTNWEIVYPFVDDYCKTEIEVYILAPAAAEYVKVDGNSVLLEEEGIYKVKYVVNEKRIDGLSSELIIDLVSIKAGYINNFETLEDCNKIIVEQGLLKSMTAEQQNEDVIEGEYSLKVKMEKADEGAKDSWPCIRIPFVNGNISSHGYVLFDIYNSGDVELTIYGCLYNVDGTRGNDSAPFVIGVGEMKTIAFDINVYKGALNLENVTGIYLWVPIFSDADREYVLDDIRFANDIPVVNNFPTIDSLDALVAEVKNGSEHQLTEYYSDGTFKQTVHFGELTHKIPAGMTGTSGEYGWAGGFLADNAQFIQVNLMNNSEVRFTYKAPQNNYVILNLGVETWSDGHYTFKVLAAGEEVYTKTADRNGDSFATVENLVVHLAEGEELVLSFAVAIPEGYSGNYERSFFVRKNLVEIFNASEEFGIPSEYASLQDYINKALGTDEPTPEPEPTISSADELLAEVKNGSETNLVGFYSDGTFKQTVHFGDTVHNVPAGMTSTSGDYGWAGGFLADNAQFVQVNLMNESVVKFAYIAKTNSYVVLNLSVETWNDGNYTFKVLAAGEEVYSKTADRNGDSFATLNNVVVYLAEGEELAISFNLNKPADYVGNYERSFFVRSHKIEVLSVEDELSAPEGFASIQEYVDLGGVLPAGAIDSEDRLLEEVNNGSTETMGTAYTKGILTQQVVYGETVYDIANGVTQTFPENQWTNAFVSETNNIQMNMGTFNGLAPVITFNFVATENCYLVLSMDIETWTDDRTVLINITSGNESVYSKEVLKEAGTGAGVVDQLSKFLVYVAKGDTCTITFSYVLPEGVTELGGTYYLRNTAVEVIEVKDRII